MGFSKTDQAEIDGSHSLLADDVRCLFAHMSSLNAADVQPM